MQVHIIVVPFDSGVRDWRMGAGPEHLIANGLVQHIVGQGHAATTSTIDLKLRTTGEIAAAFEIMTLVAGEVRTAIRHDRFPLVLSGNCSTASGTLAGLTPAGRSVFWFDAHGDANTPETTISGFLDGTALATALGWCWRGLSAQIPGFEPIGPESVMLIGTRDLDVEEAVLLNRARIRQVPAGDVARGALEDALTSLPARTQGYVHCDLDVLDPSVGQVNVFPAPGGLAVEQLERAIAAIGRTTPIVAAAVTAYAPEFDADGRVRRAAFHVIDALLRAAERP